MMRQTWSSKTKKINHLYSKIYKQDDKTDYLNDMMKKLTDLKETLDTDDSQSSTTGG